MGFFSVSLMCLWMIVLDVFLDRFLLRLVVAAVLSARLLRYC